MKMTMKKILKTIQMVFSHCKKKKKRMKEKKKKKLYLPGGSFIQSKEKKVNKIEHLKDFQLQIKECKF